MAAGDRAHGLCSRADSRSTRCRSWKLRRSRGVELKPASRGLKTASPAATRPMAPRGVGVEIDGDVSAGTGTVDDPDGILGGVETDRAEKVQALDAARAGHFGPHLAVFRRVGASRAVEGERAAGRDGARRKASPTSSRSAPGFRARRAHPREPWGGRRCQGCGWSLCPPVGRCFFRISERGTLKGAASGPAGRDLIMAFSPGPAHATMESRTPCRSARDGGEVKAGATVVKRPPRPGAHLDVRRRRAGRRGGQRFGRPRRAATV